MKNKTGQMDKQIRKKKKNRTEWGVGMGGEVKRKGKGMEEEMKKGGK